MAIRQFRLTEEQAQELFNAFDSCKDGPTRTRYQAVRLYGTGYAVSEVKLITGLSNISYGLPARKQVNRAFVVTCMVNGLDGALIDPLDTTMMSLIRATEALMNKDPFCSNYLKAFRAGLVTKD